MSWTPKIRGDNGPIYLELADAIGRAIRSGELAPGQRLPTQRELAQTLDIDQTTVTRGYLQAQRLNYIESQGRRGSFVRQQRPAVSPLDVSAEDIRGLAGPVDSSEMTAIEASGRNMPPEPEGGLLRAAIRDGVGRVLDRAGPLPVHYQPTGGIEYDRAIRASVFNRSMPTHADQVVITAGAQNAIHAICNAVLRAGDVVACGRYTYPGFLSVVRRIGARIVPVAMDEKGLVPEAIEEIARAHRLRLLYVVPSNDNPTTASLDEDRRQAIARLAEQHDFQVLEDDAYGGLIGFREKVISTLAPSRSWYVVTVAKSFTPALRVATVRAPTVRDAFGLIASIQETTTMAAPLDVALDTQWLVDGTLLQLGAAVAAEAAERQKIAREILGEGAFRAQPQSYHLWIERPDLDIPVPNSSALLAGLPVASATIFAAAPTGLEQSLRVSLGGPRSRARLASDLSRLSAFLSHSDRQIENEEYRR